MATRRVARTDLIEKVGEEYCVFTADRSRKLGCHDTREGAVAQLAAVEAAKAARRETAWWILDGRVFLFDVKRGKFVVDGREEYDVENEDADAGPVTSVQSVLLALDTFPTRERALAWASTHAFDTATIEQTDTAWRFRQAGLRDFAAGSFRTITLDAGVKAVIGRKRAARADALDTRVTVERMDFGKLGRVRRTGAGGIRVEARPTGVGILKYTRKDGTVVRELRPPDEVFDEESIASMEGVPVTRLHPDGRMVTTKNYRDHQIGHIADGVRQDGGMLATEFVIHDEASISEIDSGGLKEISAGYRAFLDTRAGRWNGDVTLEGARYGADLADGQEYDVVQRHIRYNHGALGPENWGRFGPTAALVLDAEGNLSWDTEDQEATVAKIRIDGIEYEAGSDAAMQATQKVIDRAEKAHADATAKLAKLDEERGKMDARGADLEKREKAAAEANKPEAIAARVAVRTALEADARKLGGAELKIDAALTDRQVMELAIGATDKAAKFDGLNDDYVRGLFAGRVAGVPTTHVASGGVTAVRIAAEAPAVPLKDDEKAKYDSDGARARSVKDSSEAWQRPLAASVDRARNPAS